MDIESIGFCELCGTEVDKELMKTHVIECARKSDIKGNEENIIQIFVEADGMPEYWLIIEGREKATLQQLDKLLRKTWLECCGHLSAFFDKRIQIPKKIIFAEYFTKTGRKFNYEYDFGSTTYLNGKSFNKRVGNIGKKAVRILARNNPLELRCVECEKKAEIVCPFCIDMELYLYCNEHAKKHKCAEEEAYLPVVNSPRMGVCGYTGE
jgi:hypothetical protein